MDDCPSLDALAEAFAALDEAMGHGYTPEAAYAAAADRMARLDGDQVREVAATLAALAAWWNLLSACTPSWPPVLDVGTWIQYMRCEVNDGRRP